VTLRNQVPLFEVSADIHEGVTCDICLISPIVGIRYKCSVCPDFDLCQECQTTGQHSKDHPLTKIVDPIVPTPKRIC